MFVIEISASLKLLHIFSKNFCAEVKQIFQRLSFCLNKAVAGRFIDKSDISDNMNKSWRKILNQTFDQK